MAKGAQSWDGGRIRDGFLEEGRLSAPEKRAGEEKGRKEKGEEGAWAKARRSVPVVLEL